MAFNYNIQDNASKYSRLHRTMSLAFRLLLSLSKCHVGCTTICCCFFSLLWKNENCKRREECFVVFNNNRKQTFVAPKSIYCTISCYVHFPEPFFFFSRIDTHAMRISKCLIQFVSNLMFYFEQSEITRRDAFLCTMRSTLRTINSDF